MKSKKAAFPVDFGSIWGQSIHGTNLSGIKALLYRHVFRSPINRKVVHIRNANI